MNKERKAILGQWDTTVRLSIPKGFNINFTLFHPGFCGLISHIKTVGGENAMHACLD
jgi:hypothetical protein